MCTQSDVASRNHVVGVSQFISSLETIPFPLHIHIWQIIKQTALVLAKFLSLVRNLSELYKIKPRSEQVIDHALVLLQVIYSLCTRVHFLHSKAILFFQTNAFGKPKR